MLSEERQDGLRQGLVATGGEVEGVVEEVVLGIVAHLGRREAAVDCVLEVG